MAIVMLDDKGERFSAYAVAAITSGNLVCADSGYTDKVSSSGASSYAISDIGVRPAAADASTESIVGIALETAAAAGYTTVATRGIYILRAGEKMFAGYGVQADESTAGRVAELDSAADAASKIGTALTGASASGQYLIVLLNI